MKCSTLRCNITAFTKALISTDKVLHTALTCPSRNAKTVLEGLSFARNKNSKRDRFAAQYLALSWKPMESFNHAMALGSLAMPVRLS